MRGTYIKLVQAISLVCRRTNNYFVVFFMCEAVVVFATGLGIYSSWEKDHHVMECP